MKKIDGHLHLVNTIAGFNGKGRLNSLGNGLAIWDDGTLIKLIPDGWGDVSFTAEKALQVMDKEGVEKAVLLQGSLNGYQNYYSYQMIKKYPERFIGAFSVDPFTEYYLKIVERHIKDLGFRAIKFEISQGGGLHGYHFTTPFRLDNDPRIGRIFHYLSDYPGFTITIDYGDFTQFSYQPEAIVNLAKRYPKLNFVVCHLSFPNSEHPERLENALGQFSDHDNILVDISAIEDIDKETEMPFPRAQKNVKIAKEILGSEHIIWGTDSPWSATFNSYHNLATWLENTDIFSSKELENVMYNNAKKIYFNPAAVKAVKEATDPNLIKKI